MKPFKVRNGSREGCDPRKDVSEYIFNSDYWWIRLGLFYLRTVVMKNYIFNFFLELIVVFNEY